MHLLNRASLFGLKFMLAAIRFFKDRNMQPFYLKTFLEAANDHSDFGLSVLTGIKQQIWRIHRFQNPGLVF